MMDKFNATPCVKVVEVVENHILAANDEIRFENVYTLVVSTLTLFIMVLALIIWCYRRRSTWRKAYAVIRAPVSPDDLRGIVAHSPEIVVENSPIVVPPGNSRGFVANGLEFKPDSNGVTRSKDSQEIGANVLVFEPNSNGEAPFRGLREIGADASINIERKPNGAVSSQKKR